MRKVTCCPYCGSTKLVGGQSAFLEIGEWDGKRHGSEGDAAGWICESCDGGFWVNGPRMVGEALDAPSDRCCVKCGDVIDADAEQCPHCFEEQDPTLSDDVCRTCGGPGASSDDAWDGECPECADRGADGLDAGANTLSAAFGPPHQPAF
jgi:RNA polymerase subunit RPABC4/transcription elongation factor Spt4